MEITMLKGKIHRATVTQAELNYVGSITVDTELLEAAGIMEYEYVQIVDVENGNRFETYTIAGEAGSATIHYEQPDPECDLDYVPNAGRAQAMTYALSNSLGFGGHNACIALRRWEG